MTSVRNAWHMPLVAGGAAWFVEWEPAAVSLAVRIVVDTSDSCVGDRAQMHEACDWIAARLAPGDRCEVWVIGETAATSGREMNGAADRPAVSGECDTVLEKSHPSG